MTDISALSYSGLVQLREDLKAQRLAVQSEINAAQDAGNKRMQFDAMWRMQNLTQGLIAVESEIERRRCDDR